MNILNFIICYLALYYLYAVVKIEPLAGIIIINDDDGGRGWRFFFLYILIYSVELKQVYNFEIGGAPITRQPFNAAGRCNIVFILYIRRKSLDYQLFT